MVFDVCFVIVESGGIKRPCSSGSVRTSVPSEFLVRNYDFSCFVCCLKLAQGNIWSDFEIHLLARDEFHTMRAKCRDYANCSEIA